MLDFLNAPAFFIFGLAASWAEFAMDDCARCWPLAFASALLYVLVFVDVKLFAEAVLQVFFAITALWGWWQWLRGSASNGLALQPQALPSSIAIKLVAFCAVLMPAAALFLSKFTTSDVPWWDAIPTVLSLAATYLLGRKYTANWPLWIVVNVISIALFAYKGLWLTVGLYALFTVMAAIGWRAWLLVQSKQV